MDEMTTQEAAKRLGVSVRRVQQFIVDGRLHPTRTIRGAALLSRDAIETLAAIPRPRGIRRSQEQVKGDADAH